ncbi:MAG: 30S ribosome-binding factor RbfA [Desulfobacterales bacterium]|nr:30S ribosome-binding factor RbfA [Desulfobacterales bacterium]
MKSFSRTERISALLQRNLSDILHKEIKDPRLEQITITHVKVSNDLKHARVFFCHSGKNRTKEEIIEGLNSAKGYMKRVLAKNLDLRYMPELNFNYDESFDYAQRIDLELRKLNLG